jgi:hypothetical protein
MAKQGPRINLFDVLIGELEVAIDDDILTERKQLILRLLRVLLPTAGIWYEPHLDQFGRDGHWYVSAWLVPDVGDPETPDMFIDAATQRPLPPTGSQIRRDVVTAAQAAIRRLVGLRSISVGRLAALEDEAWFQDADLKLIRLLSAFPLKTVVLRQDSSNFVLTARGKMGGAMLPKPIQIACVVHMLGREEARLHLVEGKAGCDGVLVPRRLCMDVQRAVESTTLVDAFQLACTARNRRMVLEVFAEVRPSDSKVLRVYWFGAPFVSVANLKIKRTGARSCRRVGVQGRR